MNRFRGWTRTEYLGLALFAVAVLAIVMGVTSHCP